MNPSLALATEPRSAEEAAADFLLALGVDLDDESRRDTPRRIARMYAELLTPEPFDATTFPNDGGYDEAVVPGFSYNGLLAPVVGKRGGVERLGREQLGVHAGDPARRVAARLVVEVDPEREQELLCRCLRGVRGEPARWRAREMGSCRVSDAPRRFITPGARKKSIPGDAKPSCSSWPRPPTTPC